MLAWIMGRKQCRFCGALVRREFAARWSSICPMCFAESIAWIREARGFVTWEKR